MNVLEQREVDRAAIVLAEENKSTTKTQEVFTTSLQNVQGRGEDFSSSSAYRRVFQTTSEMKESFANFLETIFFQLDTKKVFSLMEEILSDENKSDQAIYEELVQKLPLAQKQFSFLSMMKALHVVRDGVATQAAELMQNKRALSHYIEIYNRRYCRAIQDKMGVSFQRTAAVCDELKTSLKHRVEAGSLLKMNYPYQQLIALNDSDCKDPAFEVEKTYHPLIQEIPSQSVDIMACLGGLHHIPTERLEPFLKSLYEKMKPGAVLLLREHNVTSQKVRDLATVVHSFVNAFDQLSWKQEEAEIRNFQSEVEWKELLKRQGFSQLQPQKSLILDKDPTQNALTAFIKVPSSFEELKQAAQYEKKFHRSRTGSYATWIEWGNVRFAKQYAEFIQNHHAYAFDYLGHIAQHWTHFYFMMRESLAHESKWSFFFSDNMAMNLFILLGTSLQLFAAFSFSLPSQFIARWRYGKEWREVYHLSAVEQFEAEYQRDYSTFIDYVPFYQYPYFPRIQQLWKRVFSLRGEGNSIFTVTQNVLEAAALTLPLAVQGLASKAIRSFYYPSQDEAPETIQVLLEDPLDELESVSMQWDEMKSRVTYQGALPYKDCKIETTEQVGEHKLVSLPFYKPFTDIVKLLSQTRGVRLLQIGGQDQVTFDLLLGPEEQLLSQESHKIYEIQRLQDPQNLRYETHEIPVRKLQDFCRSLKNTQTLEYIHVHR